jgi:hypothetical protein
VLGLDRKEGYTRGPLGPSCKERQSPFAAAPLQIETWSAPHVYEEVTSLATKMAMATAWSGTFAAFVNRALHSIATGSSRATVAQAWFEPLGFGARSLPFLLIPSGICNRTVGDLEGLPGYIDLISSSKTIPIEQVVYSKSRN